MPLVSIDVLTDGNPPPRFALFNLGFRPFFLAATAYAVVVMALWLSLYHGAAMPLNPRWSPILWHGHEMVFGYAAAVVAGFLLTAARNWSGVATIKGSTLGALLLLWLLGRVGPWLSDGHAFAAMVADLTFNLMLCFAVLEPLARAKQWHNVSVFLPKLILFAIANLVCYLSLFGIWADSARFGLYLGLYTLLGLVFVMGRRVIGFFIERGIGDAIQLKNSRLVDIGSMVLFVLFALVDLFLPGSRWLSLLALLLVALHGWRLHAWYHPQIWRNPMLWVLYLGYLWLVAAFTLHAASLVAPATRSVALHAFLLGGVGMLSAGMMTRVSLGHSGRDVNKPPVLIPLAFALLAGGAVVRVLLPLLLPAYYATLILVAQLCWLGAFSIVFLHYLPIWWRPRVDGQPG